MFYPNNKEKIQLEQYNQDVEEFIDKKLKGKIFHVTSRESLEKIKSSGIIKAITDVNNFSQSEKCFAKQKKWVSLFDFRNKTNEQLDDSISKCLWSLLTRKFEQPVVLIVDKSFYPKLKFQEKHTKKDFDKSCYIKRDDIWESKGTYLPYTECWYPGDMPYLMVKEVIENNLEYPKTVLEKESLAYGNDHR